MGLFGALMVRPAGFSPLALRLRKPDTAYAREYLFLLSEMDYDIHSHAQFGQFNQIDTTTFKAVLWFINGWTSGPDTMAMPMFPGFPSQPYNCMPRMHPGEKILLRFIGGGRDLHPLHTHGQHSRVIARDGRLLEIFGIGPGGSVPMEFTVTVAPGQTADSLYQWTGAKLGWDIYGTSPHSCVDRGDGFDNTTYEYCRITFKPLPTIPPDVLNDLERSMVQRQPPPGNGRRPAPRGRGVQPTSAYLYMFHSHNENEIVNFNIFPGGMLTMAAVEHPSVPLGPHGLKGCPDIRRQTYEAVSKDSTSRKSHWPGMLLAGSILRPSQGHSQAVTYNLYADKATLTMPDTLEVITMWGFGLEEVQ